MAKKKNNQAAKAAKDQAPVEDAKVEVTTPVESAAAVATIMEDTSPIEEQKVDADLINKQAATPCDVAADNDDVEVDIKPKASLGKRQGSRFDLTKDEEGEECPEESNPLYRPDFGAQVDGKQDKMWELMGSYIGGDQRSIQRSIVNHVEYTLARTRFDFDDMGAYQATAYSVRDRLIEAWNDTQQYHEVSFSTILPSVFDVFDMMSSCTLSQKVDLTEFLPHLHHLS